MKNIFRQTASLNLCDRPLHKLSSEIIRGIPPMNNQPLVDNLNQSSGCPENAFLFPFWLFMGAQQQQQESVPPADPNTQRAKWLYVTTVADGTKTYLRNEIKILPNRNREAWMKMLHSDGSSFVARTEWDCLNQRRINRRIILYSPDNLLAGKPELTNRWEEIVPDSICDLLYVRICLPAQPVKWAQIIAPDTPLRQKSEIDSPVTRTAQCGERFEIIFETEKRRRVNVVDHETQEDYWLPRDEFETVEGGQSPIKHIIASAAAAAATNTAVSAVIKRKRKPQKAGT